MLKSPREPNSKKDPRQTDPIAKNRQANNYFLSKQKTEKSRKTGALVPCIDLNNTQKNIEFKKSNVPLIQPLNLNYNKTPNITSSLQ